MLLKKTSVLRRLPLLDEKQLLILDSLRFTIDIIDYNYGKLQNRILGISTGKEYKIHPQVFHYAWSMLDNIRRFIRIYKVLEEAYRFIAISGILYGNPGKVEFIEFDKSIVIENIYLETVDRKKQTEINISQLYLDFQKVVYNLEKELEIKISENKSVLNDWSSRQDVILKIKRNLPTDI